MHEQVLREVEVPDLVPRYYFVARQRHAVVDDCLLIVFDVLVYVICDNEIHARLELNEATKLMEQHGESSAIKPVV